MKKLEDLKKELLQDKVSKFYVFYGDDYGIRKHYINKIATYFPTKPNYIFDHTSIKLAGKSKSLFGPKKELVVIYGDEDFAKLSQREISKFIENLNQYTCIFVYETPIENSTLFNEFGDYITNFPIVQDNIGREFVKSEVDIGSKDIEVMAYNCENNYSKILLESDKIKEYSQAKNVTDKVAFETLSIKNQLEERIDTFNAKEFMNDILIGNTHNFAYWYEVITNDTDKFFSATMSIFNDYLIAGLLKEHGSYDGSSAAYNYKLPWNRTKEIRLLNIQYSSDYLFNCAYKVACIDDEVKSGVIAKEKVVDYFFSSVI